MLLWILFPIIGAAIGWLTNKVAIQMLFHPREKRFGVQGLLPRRKADLAKSIGEVVANELVSVPKLLEPLNDIDLRPMLERTVDQVMERKIGELQKIPLIGSMITPERLSGLRDGFIEELLANKEAIMSNVIGEAQKHIDVGKIVEERLLEFELDRFEELVKRVAQTEFRAIELWGAVIGALVGLVQVLLMHLLGNAELAVGLFL